MLPERQKVMSQIVPATSSFSSNQTKTIRFKLSKDYLRKLELEPGVLVYHMYPTLDIWLGRELPDDVNPRSHEEEAVKGNVPKAIRETLKETPRDFYLANRGATVLLESLTFNPDTQTVEMVLADYEGDSANQGIADGGTSDAVIARIQKEAALELGFDDFRKLSAEQVPTFLSESRFHIEAIVGLKDRDRIRKLVHGRNKSIQVKEWTINDFQGDFQWMKNVLEDSRSPFKGKIGYEENAIADVGILEVIAILTLFHPAYNEKGKAPTTAYSSRGSLNNKLTNQEFAPGYKSLSPVMLDILKLHDFVYCNFQKSHDQAIPGGRLGRRGKAGNRIFPQRKIRLPLTDKESDREVPNGVLYPLLASLRALIQFENDQAKWRTDPVKFFEDHGGELVETLFSQLESLGNNPQTLGKNKVAYTSLFDRARVLMFEEEQ
jgi:hypothetical protein